MTIYQEINNPIKKSKNDKKINKKNNNSISYDDIINKKDILNFNSLKSNNYTKHYFGKNQGDVFEKNSILYNEKNYRSNEQSKIKNLSIINH